MVHGTPTRPEFRISVTIGDKAVCELFQAHLGGMVDEMVYQNSPDREENNKRRYFRRGFRWIVYDGYLIVEIVQRLLPFLHGEKSLQGEAFQVFAREKLRCYERRVMEQRLSYTEEERYTLLRLAYNARMYAGGGRKEWRSKWAAELERLEGAKVGAGK